jgi:hypothetical protein
MAHKHEWEESNFEITSKRRKGFPSETNVKRGVRIVHGYPAYHVRYIERSPLTEVPEDWFAGFEVRLVARKEKVEKAADAAGAEIQKSTGKPEDRATLLDYAKRAVVKVSILQRQLRQQSFKTPSTSAADSTPKPNDTPKTG